MPKAYLVVHKMALYNDIWYDDWTFAGEAANPTALLTSRAEAEALVQQLTRETVRGAATLRDLEPDEATYKAVQNIQSIPGIEDPALIRMIRRANDWEWVLPDTLTNAQLDSLIAALGIQIYFILETEADEFDLRLAQSLLELTPERPRVYVYRDLELRFNDPDDLSNKDSISVERIDPSDDPAVERLNRVTALFGRKYAFEPNSS